MVSRSSTEFECKTIYVDALIAYGGGYSGKDAAQAERVGARNGPRWCHPTPQGSDHA